MVFLNTFPSDVGRNMIGIDRYQVLQSFSCSLHAKQSVRLLFTIRDTYNIYAINIFVFFYISFRQFLFFNFVNIGVANCMQYDYLHFVALHFLQLQQCICWSVFVCVRWYRLSFKWKLSSIHPYNIDFDRKYSMHSYRSIADSHSKWCNHLCYEINIRCLSFPPPPRDHFSQFNWTRWLLLFHNNNNNDSNNKKYENACRILYCLSVRIVTHAIVTICTK